MVAENTRTVSHLRSLVTCRSLLCIVYVRNSLNRLGVCIIRDSTNFPFQILSDGNEFPLNSAKRDGQLVPSLTLEGSYSFLWNGFYIARRLWECTVIESYLAGGIVLPVYCCREPSQSTKKEEMLLMCKGSPGIITICLVLPSMNLCRPTLQKRYPPLNWLSMLWAFRRSRTRTLARVAYAL